MLLSMSCPCRASTPIFLSNVVIRMVTHHVKRAALFKYKPSAHCNLPRTPIVMCRKYGLYLLDWCEWNVIVPLAKALRIFSSGGYKKWFYILRVNEYKYLLGTSISGHSFTNWAIVSSNMVDPCFSLSIIKIFVTKALVRQLLSSRYVILSWIGAFLDIKCQGDCENLHPGEVHLAAKPYVYVCRWRFTYLNKSVMVSYYNIHHSDSGILASDAHSL